MSELFDYWKELLFNPKQFFEKEFRGNKKIRFSSFAMGVFFIGYGIERIDTQLVKFDMRGNLDQILFINDWIVYWLFVIISGAIGGYIFYLIGGWFYNVRLKWSGGSGNLDLSRNLFLYANFYIYLNVILITFAETIIHSRPYDPNAEMDLFDIIAILLSLFFIFHSIHLSFTGIVTVTNANVRKVRIWFVLIPIFFYLFLFGTVIMVLLNYVTEF